MASLRNAAFEAFADFSAGVDHGEQHLRHVVAFVRGQVGTDVPALRVQLVACRTPGGVQLPTDIRVGFPFADDLGEPVNLGPITSVR